MFSRPTVWDCGPFYWLGTFIIMLGTYFGGIVDYSVLLPTFVLWILVSILDGICILYYYFIMLRVSVATGGYVYGVENNLNYYNMLCCIFIAFKGSNTSCSY